MAINKYLRVNLNQYFIHHDSKNWARKYVSNMDGIRTPVKFGEIEIGYTVKPDASLLFGFYNDQVVCFYSGDRYETIDVTTRETVGPGNRVITFLRDLYRKENHMIC